MASREALARAKWENHYLDRLSSYLIHSFLSSSLWYNEYMNKILLIIPFLIGGISFAQAQKNDCTGSNQKCSGNNKCVLDWHGANMPDNLIGGKCMTPAEADAEKERRVEYLRNGGSLPPQSMGGNENNNININTETKKCPDRTVVWQNEKCPDCMEALSPQNLTRNPSTLPTGNTTNGFGVGARKGLTCKYTESIDEIKVNTCARGLDTQRSRDGSRDSYKKYDRDWYGIYWGDIQKECGQIIVNGVVTYPKPGKWDCDKTASVLDTLWAFITHKRGR